MSDASHGQSARSIDTLAWPLMVVLFGLLVTPVIVLNGGGTSEAYDQIHHHEPVIRSFARQLPHLDLRTYVSATTPGYHLTLALVCKWISDETMVLQLAGSLFSLAWLVCLYVQLRQRLTPWSSLACIMPLLMSAYFLGGAIWLVTDNAAWLFVAMALGGLLSWPSEPARVLRWGAYASIAVMIRQIHVWLAAPIGWLALTAGLMGRSLASRGTTMVAGVSGALLPAVVVGSFVVLWRGLTPPAFAAEHSGGLNLAVLPLTLAVFGAMGVFFLGAYARSWRALGTMSSWQTISWVILLLVCIAIPTSYDVAAGRWGGSLWELARRGGAIQQRSYIMVLLAAIGSWVLLVGLRSAFNESGWQRTSVLVVALVGWLAAQTVSTLAFQRYIEPMVLMTLMWLVLLSGAPARGRWWMGPLALAGCQGGYSVLTLYWPVLNT